MTVITHAAAFGATDTLDRVLAEIACPACGYRDPDDIYRVRPGNRMRFFCDGCGAFVTILLSPAQAETVRRWAALASGDPVAGAHQRERA